MLALRPSKKGPLSPPLPGSFVLIDDPIFAVNVLWLFPVPLPEALAARGWHAESRRIQMINFQHLFTPKFHGAGHAPVHTRPRNRTTSLTHGAQHVLSRILLSQPVNRAVFPKKERRSQSSRRNKLLNVLGWYFKMAHLPEQKSSERCR